MNPSGLRASARLLRDRIFRSLRPGARSRQSHRLSCYTGLACPALRAFAMSILKRCAPMRHPMSRLRVALLLFVCLLISRGALAQDVAPVTEQAPAPAHLGFLDGSAEIEREGRSEAAVVNAPLLPGDRIRSDMGRVEVIFPDGSVLHLDNRTVVDVLEGDLLRLLQGRIMLVAAGATDPSRLVRYQVDTPAASVQVNRPGEYRVAILGNATTPETELAVMHGEATLASQLGSLSVRAGERSLVREGVRPSAPQYFNSARWDAFDRWSQDRQEARTGRRSAQYLPQDLRTYSGDFDRYGTWENEPTYGNVWYPTVPGDWRPYSNGYWNQYPAYGCVWIGHDQWSWPTHHYGRWGLGRRGAWYWIPGTRWASAWVHWATAPGYVSWSPLGYNDLPVIGYWGVQGVFAAGGFYDPWNAWTVIPSHSFGLAIISSRVAVRGHRLSDRDRSRFVAHRNQPTIGRAVPRRSADVDQRGDQRNGPGRAVPRGNADGGRPDTTNDRRGNRVDASDAPRGATATDTRAIRNRFPRPGGASDEGARVNVGENRTPGTVAVPRRREVPGAAEAPAPRPDAGSRTSDAPERRIPAGNGREAMEQPRDSRRRFPDYRSMPVEQSNPDVASPRRREIPQAPARVETPRPETSRPEMPRPDAPRMRFPDRSPALREPQGRPESSRGTERGAAMMPGPERGAPSRPERPPQAAPSRPRSGEGAAAPRQRAPERSGGGSQEGGRRRR